MTTSVVLVLAVLVAGWSLCGRPLEARGLSGPMVFLAAGALLSEIGLVDVSVEASSIRVIVELALVLALFSDASTVDLRDLGRHGAWAARMLVIALPATILLGTVAALAILPALSWPTALLLAASLSATDASLSASVLNDSRVPHRVRLALNLESGLNDGLATPVVLGAIVATAASLGLDHATDGAADYVIDLVGGAALGAVLGAFGGWAGLVADRRGWTEPGGRRLATLAVPIAVMAAAELTGLSMFIAAFVAGLAFGAVITRADTDLIELPEFASETLAWITWFLFGACLLVRALEDIDVRTVAYAVLSLTVLRMGPVALSLRGSTADRATTTFLGWFGPRGLATIVFGLIIVEDLDPGAAAIKTVVATLTLTMVLSVIAHAVSASPMSRWIQRSTTAQPST